MNRICRISHSPLVSISHAVGKGRVHLPHNIGGVSLVQQLVCNRVMMHSSRCAKVFSSSEDDESDGSKYSTSEDDVVGFGRVIRDPRMSKRDILKESLPGGPSKKSGMQKKTGTPVVLGGQSESDPNWDELDQHVNEYPGNRTFKAIGYGGDDFTACMRNCVEQVLGDVKDDCIRTRESAEKKYISVTIGPVLVESPDQVKEIYTRMQADGRMKFFI